jgi:hypothetical protein
MGKIRAVNVVTRTSELDLRILSLPSLWTLVASALSSWGLSTLITNAKRDRHSPSHQANCFGR